MNRNFPRKAAGAVLLAFLTAFTSGCSLIPKEEELPTAPYLSEAETESYVLTPVMVGDVVVSEQVRSYYVPSSSEKLGFEIGGEYIKNIYVELGDEVHAGDVLMELDVSEIEQQISSQEQEVNDLYRQLSDLEENRDLALEAASLEDARAAADQTSGWVSRVDSVTAEYTQQLNAVYTALNVSEARLKELKEEKAQRQLVAGIDGVVTMLSWMGEHYRTEKGDTLIEISDMSGALFEVFSDNGDLLTSGQTYELICNDETYEVTAYLGAELISGTAGSGSEETAAGENAEAASEDSSEQGTPSVDEEQWYLEMVTPDPSIGRNDTGIISIVTSRSDNTLYVQKNAVKEINGVSYVYVLDDQGFKTSREVTTGLTDGKVIEILSGAEEGEYLIVP